MSIKLSICLMEYNRGDVIYRSVRSLLECPRDDFQVVVRDDASTDNTVELLSSVIDDRIKLNVNEKNLGAPLNWLYALKDGDGDWLYLAMGRDILDHKKIPLLISVLEKIEKQGVAVARDIEGGDYKILGYEEGINYFLSFGDHPTGLIYRRDAFEKIKDPESWFRIKGFIYPEVCLIRDILLSNRGAVINAGLYGGDQYIDLISTKSGIKFDEELFYFAPNARYIEFKTILALTEDADGKQIFKLNKKQADDRFIYLFNQLIVHVSIAWKIFLLDEVLTQHYNMKKRRLTKKEMIKNLIDAYRRVKQDHIYLNRVRRVKMAYWMLKIASEITME